MARVVKGAAGAIESEVSAGGNRYKAAMITVTYAPGSDYEPGDISTLMQRIRDYLARRSVRLRAVWVLELQRRGAPHYHVLVWLPRTARLPKPDKQGWWTKGLTRIEWARSAVGYIAKYASKTASKTAALPRGARIYGIYGCHTPLAWWRAPAWLREITARGDRIRTLRGGWRTIERLAIAIRSPWRVLSTGSAGIEIVWQGWTPADVVPLWLAERAAQVGP